MADTLDQVVGEIKTIQHDARENGIGGRPRWPMIVLRTPKGWTGPKEVDGKKTEDYWRSHQVPMAEMASNPGHIALLEEWMRSYRPEELFDENGTLHAELRELAPTGVRRMGANPHANGGLLLRDLRMPDFHSYAVDVPKPGTVVGEATKVMGSFLRDVMKLNMSSRNFRVFAPDELASNRLNAIFDVTPRCWSADMSDEDDNLASDGRVMEMLSEHTCQGWLEGYLLTGRHGLFTTYEAFVHIVDSMFNQHAKWLKVTSREIPWRRPVASLTYLLSSHVWRQDHNGFSHQDPGFIDHVVNKKAEVISVYLPPDANSLLWVTDECLRSRDSINVIVAGKQPALQYLDMDAAVKHCTAGIGIWEWASNDRDSEPDVVMACCGDIPTLETLAAVDLLRTYFPELRDSRRQRGRSHAPAAPEGAPARAFRRRLRQPLHGRQADHLRLPRLPLAHPPAHVPSHGSQQPPRARVQGGGDHDDAVRHGRPQRPRSLPPRRRRDRPAPPARRQRRLREAGDPREARRAHGVHLEGRRRHAFDPRLAVAALLTRRRANRLLASVLRTSVRGIRA